MKNIIKCFCINVIRNFSNSMSMIISVLIIPIVVLTSFYINNLSGDNVKIAVVGEDSQFIQYLEENHISYDLKEENQIRKIFICVVILELS
ncbi:hypothetical protein [Sedimentibacter sp. zth1]|uniref:hypothetical protein n=1 Tax=Sedimentibacter sp. zth1 TaxID=2816908 RepID=UPI001F5F9261|nr:hypothetical protein [Sedimentibacter sp. zth1]